MSRVDRKYIEELKKLQVLDVNDPEAAHSEADKVLCELLKELTYTR